MVSIIKNQLLKHLSRFTKNLSADKINLSTFKGEGELSNLELDETVLTELLELPSWLRLTSAWCNRVSFRIQWTKLKSVPIFLSLDEVYIEVETCEELRSMSTQLGLSSYSGNAKYSFINKVIDGMTVSVNTVQVTFKSPAFIASVQMQRIMVESKSPSWQRCDLRMTRLKEPDRGQLLIFKELEWQTVRIEARSTKDKELTPLRLLTNQARCRITIKKRIADCFVMGSRLVLILDDLLWVLTDSQLKAALHFLDSLTGLVQKATELTRIKKAARKLEVLPEYQAQISQQARSKELKSAISRIFSRYDVVETSYHFLSQRIDLHLCDDPGDGRSVHPDLKGGGALQISLQHFQVDYYPYHLAIGDRKHWPKYREGASPHAQWLDQALAAFRNSFLDVIDQGRVQHTPLVRTQAPAHVAQQGPSKTATAGDNAQQQPLQQQAQESQKKGSAGTHGSTGNPVKNYVLTQLAKLMTTCVVLRIQDFTLYQVTTSQRKQTPKEFIAGDRDRYSMPEELCILHAEFTYYYYPGDIPFPLPSPKFYVQVNPIQIHFDLCSCLWLSSFALNLHQSLLSSSPDRQQAAAALMHMDVKLEAIMPRVIFESSADHPNQRDRPKSLHFQVSRASVTNVRSMEHSSRADLAKCIDTYQLGSLFYGADFPALPDDYHVVTEKFLRHVAGTDNVRSSPPPHFAASSVLELERMLSRELLWTEAKDVWCVNLEPVWGDFFGASAVGSTRPVPFLDAFPLTLWIYIKMPLPSSLNGAISTLRKDHRSIPSSHNIPPTQSSVSSSLSSSSIRTAVRVGVDKTGIYHQGFEASEISSDVTNGRKTDCSSFNHIASRGFQDVSKVNVITQPTSDTSRTCAGNQENVKTADIHMLAYVSNLVSIQINHYQFLFLLRLSEEAAELATFLALDSNRILKQELGGSLVMGALIPQLEATFVMPSQSPGKECSGGDLESVLPDSASIPEELMGVNNNLAASSISVLQSGVGGGKRVTVGGVSTPVSELSSLSMDFPPHEVTCSTVTATTNITASTTANIGYTKPAANGPHPVTAFPNISIPNNLNAGISSMKKGFSSLMTSIDSALKPSPDDASDTVSLRSDASSDSENYVVVNMGGDSGAADKLVFECMDAMFRVDPSSSHGETPLPQQLEVASEVVPEEEDATATTTTPSEHSVDSSCKRKDLVSMTTFKLGKVEFVQQSQGFSSAIKVQVSSLTSEECGAIPWDEFQARVKSKFSCRSRAWMEVPMDATGHPRARIRLNHTVNPGEIVDRSSFKEWCKDHMEIKVNDLSLDLSMSTVAGLADLVEDEVIPQPFPMQMVLDNVKLCLSEDRPSANITSPGPIPINLEVSELVISRGLDGVFHIEPPVEAVRHPRELFNSVGVLSESALRHLAALEHSNKQLQAENAELKRRLAALERVSKENHTLRQSTEESQILRSCLATAQDDVASLLEEKRSLLDRMRRLQDQVEQSQRSKR
ncbi:UHRF1-binding protein 1-like isoform X3 [Cryptotermes secundus]|uniref:UHRF1-binding protein 1-like isoform X3 n=1 Tax=Cryptotermes secundus TaxID=105785 RepID=UPI001454DA86|nr:UHRF1-binding protein 1-like isoform X3 [Cryptotermes secundus]